MLMIEGNFKLLTSIQQTDFWPWTKNLCHSILHSLPLTDRKKVLLHHPDKRKAAGKEVLEDDDYFTNITKGLYSDPNMKSTVCFVCHTCKQSYKFKHPSLIVLLYELNHSGS